MREGFLLLVIALTSTGAWTIGTLRFGLDSRALGAAVGRMLESLGVIVLFFGANLLVSGAVILTARAVGPAFVSLYVAADVTLLVVSVLQGLGFQAWRGAVRRPPPADGRA